MIEKEYTAWPENFPETTCLVPYAELRHSTDPEIQELYDKAKNHESREAATELIHRLVTNEGIETTLDKIKQLAEKHPEAIIVPVHAVEGRGKNAIPATLAAFIGETGNLVVDKSIVQSSIVSNTGQNSWHRLAYRSEFEGPVKQGGYYILVDDVISAGGTFNELRHFIEKNGGTVVDTIAMTNGTKTLNAVLAITPGHILELERKYGVESLQQFLKEEHLYGGNHKALTDSEARTLLGAKTLDEARNRIAEARQERDHRIRPEVVPGTSPDTEEKNLTPQSLDNITKTPLDGSGHIENASSLHHAAERSRPNTGKSIPYEGMNINHKEFIMSDVSENTEETVGSADVSAEIENRGEPRTPEEVAFLNALHQRNVISESLENGKLPCLPGVNGFADTSPAVNIANDTRYHGVNLLYLKDFQTRNGFPSAEFITRDQIDKARTETGDQIFIRKDQKPVTVSFKVQNEGSGEWEQKNVMLYNVAQTTKPWALKAWAEKHVQEKQQEKQEFLKQQYGDQYKPYEPKQKGPGPEIACSSTEPEKYLGQYLAAVSMGGTFKVSPEQAKEFAANLKTALSERHFDEKYAVHEVHGQTRTDPFKLSKVCQAAGQECKEVMREIGREQRQQTQEQNQEQKISRGRSR
ncbi:MAG: phosphoribosyltransferase [Treponema sp.]|jgi:adenine/guanine phosphoribosyltransferase-like PRPP-binding protein|nr:phosphoribosyltransferase [Treponema sp.]